MSASLLMEGKRVFELLSLFLTAAIIRPCASYQTTFESVEGKWIENGAQETYRNAGNTLSKPFVGNDGRIYSCSQKSFFAFESNGTIAWAVPLNYTCHPAIAPLQDAAGKIYLVAEDRVLKIWPSRTGSGELVVEILFGPEAANGGLGEVVGITISIWSFSLYINVKNRGLFAYTLHGRPLWIAGPVLSRFGYRQGCKENVSNCYFTSAPIIDQCQGNLYMLNTEGQLYSISIQRPHYNWIQDFSAVDNFFTVASGNNGRLYLAFPRKSIIMALEVSSGNVLWEQTVGPLSAQESSLVVDSNGWASIGSLDGFLYSFSPTGERKKYLKGSKLKLVLVSPLLDCSGTAVYVSQTTVEEKITHLDNGSTYTSATKSLNVDFTLLVPASGAVHWHSAYNGQLSSLLFESELRHFTVDEKVLLAFITAANSGRHLQSRSIREKLARTCSQAKPKSRSIYIGNEKTIFIFLFFQFGVLIALALTIRFCYIFWGKKKLKDKDLRVFLEKRRSLHHKKKECTRKISELEKKVAEDAGANDILEKIGDMVKEREVIERKLSTTYSLGRDNAGGSRSRSLLPLYNGKSKSYSFQSSKRESVTLFDTLSGDGSSSREGTTSSRSSSWTSVSGEEEEFHSPGDKASAVKGKATIRAGSLGGSTPMSEGSKGYANPLFVEKSFNDLGSGEIQMEGEVEEEGVTEVKTGVGSSRSVLKRRRTMSSC